jgi:hypothetical protein
MKNNLIILIFVALFIIAIDPKWAFLIACLILTIILLSIGGEQ